MQSVYSFCGSPIHLLLEDSVADSYNVVATALADRDLKTYIIREGTVKHTLVALDEDVAAYNNIANLINMMCEINGGSLDIDPEALPSIHLERI